MLQHARTEKKILINEHAQNNEPLPLRNNTICNGTRVPLCVTLVTVRDDYIMSLLRSMR